VVGEIGEMILNGIVIRCALGARPIG